MKSVLFWGRYGNYGPDYPRNRVVESVMSGLGCRVSRFLPSLSMLADVEYSLRGGKKPDVIWVPCFRQRDLPAGAKTVLIGGQADCGHTGACRLLP